MPMVSRYFAVTVPEGMSDIKLDSRGCATCQITVKNVSASAIDGRASLVSLPISRPPAGAVEKNWVTIDGPAERYFAIDHEEVFSIRIAVPQKRDTPAPAGNYSFCLDAVNVARPDDSGDQSQALRFTVAAAAPTGPSRWPLIATVAAVVLVVAGLATWLLTSGKPVPDLRGKTTTEASAILSDAKFTLDQNMNYVDSDPKNSGLVVAQNPRAGRRASAGSLVKISLGATTGPVPAHESVQCSVFDDGYTNLAGPSDAVFLNPSTLQACVPDNASGTCRKWFGRCTTTVSHSPVYYTGATGAKTDAVNVNHDLYGLEACTPDGTCRHWFGGGTTRNGRTVVCNVFDDGFSNTIGPTGTIYPRSASQGWPMQLCLDGTPQGACRKWFGRCIAQ